MQDLKGAIAAVDQGTKAIATFFAAFLLFTAYVVVTVASTTDLMFLLQSPLKLPVIDVEIPLHNFYLIVPVVYLLIHINLLLHVWILRTQAIEFEKSLRAANSSDPVAYKNARMSARRMLYPFLITRAILSTEDPEPPAFFFRLAYFTTVIAVPVATLLYIQLRFLPYHHEGFTWLHRSCVLLDLAIVVTFLLITKRLYEEGSSGAQSITNVRKWLPFGAGQVTESRSEPADTNGSNDQPVSVWPRFKKVVSSIIGGVAIGALYVTAVAIVYASLFFLTVPGEGLDQMDWALGPILDRYEPYIEQVQREKLGTDEGASGSGNSGGPIYSSKELHPGWITCGLGWIAASVHRNLEITDTYIGTDLPKAGELAELLTALESEVPKERVEAERWLKAMPRLDLKGRDLTYAVFDGSTFINPDFDRVRSDFASYNDCSLYGMRLTSTVGQGQLLAGDGDAMEPSFKDTHWLYATFVLAELSVADLQRADLTGAKLQGAVLSDAQLQRAVLTDAQLQGADLRWAQLQGADLRWAQLQGADLTGAQLQGADLSSARFQGAVLSDALLQGASLSDAMLQGADLSSAQSQGAVFKDAQLQGADLRWAQLQGADISRAQLQAADLSGVALFGASADFSLPVNVSFAQIDAIDLTPPEEESRIAWRQAASKFVEHWAAIEERFSVDHPEQRSFIGGESAIAPTEVRKVLGLPSPKMSSSTMEVARLEFLVGLAKEDPWVAIALVNRAAFSKRFDEESKLADMLDAAYRAKQIKLPPGYEWPLSDTKSEN